MRHGACRFVKGVSTWAATWDTRRDAAKASHEDVINVCYDRIAFDRAPDPKVLRCVVRWT